MSFSTANDISRGSYNFARVRATLAGAHGIMTAAAFAQANIISARREGRTVQLRPITEAEDMSILASVMGITQEVSIPVVEDGSTSVIDHHRKTINHRRVVQEVYDRQVLHRMLGVTPKASLTDEDAVQGVSRTAGAASVEAAWGAADTTLDAADSIGSEDEMVESRYEIESRKQPPKKRRRVGTRADEDITLHTVYTTDEDEEEHSTTHQPRGDEDGVTDEEKEYDLSALDADHHDPGGGPGRTEAANRRSYWLSKAMAGGDESDE